MDAIHTIILTIGLFILTFINPGANLLVVVQTSLTSGKNAGILTGLGVALGDALYSGLGLFGMAALITEGGQFFSGIKIFGGLYLIWYAYNMIRHPNSVQMYTGRLSATTSAPWYVFFRRGLLTDLSNPQTVLFFVSIFSVTLTPATPLWAKVLAWLGIVIASIIWRTLLSIAFSLPAVRRGYTKVQQAMRGIIGVALGAFGLRLIYEGFMRR
ncbi:LysE family transporter [Edaphovirga cremea]|uniref:LysE family transporter n=1 Tax=Edaphovirga cremea TaxID=2267246 RepID=UPI000DEFCAD1|nr:LysE family transporter [Edaphovirga cremea]